MNRHGLPLKYIVPAVIAIILAPIGVYGIAGEAGLQITSVVISGLLTLALVVLYAHQYSAQSEQTDIMEDQQAVQERQTSIMEQQQTIDEKQTELMERDYESEVHIGQITAMGDYIYITLNNAGRGTVQQIHLRSEIVSDTGSLDIKPGRSQVTAVEGKGSTLPGFSPPKEFKAEVLFTQPRDSGEERIYPFRYFADELAQAGISECTIHLTLEIVDESTRTEEDIIEMEIADQEVTTSEVVEREVPAEVGKPDTFKAPLKTQLEDAIKLISPQDILPHDFEERYRSLPQDDETH